MNLFPEIPTFDTGHLKVSDIHEIYYEQAGNPRGIPVVFLHGGPGGGINPDHRRFFDPNHYRIVLFDQRGCGQSTPHAELRENTTWDLVADIEKLRTHLGINKWHLFGGSWGSTLALAYAITYPEKSLSLMLRGIFLCRPSELQWFYQQGASQIFPDFWEKYENFIPPEERNDFIRAYYKRLTSENQDHRLQAARIWSQWEAATSRLIPKADAVEAFEDPHLALAFARIECHYFINNAFFKTDNWILENASKIAHLPCRIVQGRYDVVCPPKSAWELHQALPKSELVWGASSGHAAMEPEICAALLQTTQDFKRI